ncbi:MAG: hypothetical protein HZA22_12510 [Nitrospirae bacterium]|nr:hypothetical protein [Nitrospirota bacterium]
MTFRLKHHAVTALMCIAVLYLSCIAAYAATATYTYDDLNRLETIEYGGGTIIRYAYDEVGNRILSGPIADDLPASFITDPDDGATLSGANALITGSATAWGSDLQMVEVSTDGGANWRLATGTERWSYTWTLSADGSYNLKTRATDASNSTEVPGTGINVTVANNILEKVVWAWGSNGNGQVGDGTLDPRKLTPVQVGGLSA